MAETEKSESTLAQAAAKGAESVQSALETALEAARNTAHAIQSAAKTSDTPTGVAVTKGFEFAKQNISALFGFAQQLAKASNLQEAAKLQAEFVRAQSEEIAKQAEAVRSIVNTPPGGTAGGADGGGKSTS